MTKSQNTKKEQHCIKQNEKSFIQKDLSLTELWQKGELEDGYYFIKMSYQGAIIPLYYNKDYGFEYDDHFFDFEEISEVLAPVPTFEEWKANEKYNKHLEEVIKVYERKDKQATKTSIAYNELAQENEELKEILERHKKATAKAQIRNCDLEIINAQLKKWCEEFNALEVVKENEQLKEEVSRESYKVSEAYCFVEELKELLKECRDVLQKNILSAEEYKLLHKIDEVLK